MGASPRHGWSRRRRLDPNLGDPAVSAPVTGGTGRGSVPDFDAVYRTEVTAVVRHVMAHGATVEEAWDATQTAFVDAYPVWSTVRSPRAWLRMVAVRKYLGSAVPETPTDTPPDRPDPSSPALRVEFGEEERLLLAALAGLPAKQRRVMAWAFEGYGPGETAELLGEDPAAVRQNLHRARKNLTQRLSADGRDTR